MLEKLVLLRHCHTDQCQVHGAAAQLVIIGDAFHNFIDGAIIAAAVLTSLPLGINTAIAIAAHEIPQEVGDIAILLHSGYSPDARARPEHRVGGRRTGRQPARLQPGQCSPRRAAVRARLLVASMLYIAMSDLIPDLHRGTVDRNSLRQVLLIGAGIATVVVFERFTH